MSSFGHKMILASAGSGKTYALTNRFVQLLARDAKPERIVALTFTRKAAGEFFDEILNKLARAARDPKEAKRIAGEIGEPQLGTADFLRMLRSMVSSMHRLSLGTLDGFFARVVRAFPLELGLGGDFEILQEHGAQIERQRVLRQLFARSGGELDDAQKEFIEAFKRATFGSEEKRLAARLDRFLDDHQELFLDASDGPSWGNAESIWPEGSLWLKGVGEDETNAAAEALRRWSVSAGLGEKQLGRWSEFLVALEAWAPGAMLPRELVYVLEKAVENWAALLKGDAVLEFDRKKQTLTEEACAALVVLTQTVFAGELKRRMEMTQGIHTVLRGYEAVYHDLVRRAGRLTFADVQRLLMPNSGARKLTSGARASADGADVTSSSEPLAHARSYDSDEGRLAVDWRLDAKFDHWLLDEFQDTSHGQWSVLRNLIDEAVQDPEGRRSFFYVGDVKQAIFAWRGGDPRLFREIFDHYNNAAQGTIEEGRLDQSWRSGPAIVATVNKIFGNADVIARMVPAPTAQRWTREWRDHESARPQLGGHVAWLHGDDDVARAAVTLNLLGEIEPLERGLTVAVLVQSNDAATWLADYLRREGGIAAVAASDLHVATDNPLTTAVLALLQAAAHPGDTLAWEHVRMTPLANAMLEAGLSAENLTEGVLHQVHRDGFARTVETWLRRLDSSLAADDAFSRERGRLLTEAAQVFDESGSRDVAEFVLFAGRHVVRDAETASVVRVMTIHKSKGLGFDVVVLPDLEGNSLSTRRRDGLAVQRSPERAVEWVLDMPPKLFHENDEVLAAHVAAAEADAAYEKLCLYYVALTRAKRAMYLITKPTGAKSVSTNFPRLMAETLGTSGLAGGVTIGKWSGDALFAEGDAEWFKAIDYVDQVAVVEAVVEANTDGPAKAGDVNAAGVTNAGNSGSNAKPSGGLSAVLTLPAVERHLARTPSGTKVGVVAGAALFGAGGTSAASFGTAVHAAFAAVEWGGVTPAVLAAWEAAGLGEKVVAEARACLEVSAVAEVFAKKPRAEVWRERTFEIVLDGSWITGVFDRVVITCDANGRPLAATVYDFKTDRVADGEITEVARRYAGQLAIYREAAARLTGLATSYVRCALVLTAVQRVVVVGG